MGVLIRRSSGAPHLHVCLGKRSNIRVLALLPFEARLIASGFGGVPRAFAAGVVTSNGWSRHLG